MRKNLIIFLSLVTFSVWLSVISVDDRLRIIACDVGQGDAILIQRQTDQILIDGGPDSTVLDCLGKYMPFWDRELELVVNTHPEKDHLGGLIDVFERYQVDTFLTNDLSKPVFSTELVEVLKSKVGGSTAGILHPTDNLQLRLGLMQLDILSPTEEMKNSRTLKPNDLSIVILLKYGEFKGLFTGDIENVVSDKLSVEVSVQGTDYLKVPHHGSKNGLSQKLLDATMPGVAVISVGAKNSYGHPHQEVIKILSEKDIKILRTDQIGDVVVETDGKELFIPNR